MTRKAIDPNSIKVTLDQMGQTVEAMNGVINQLKTHLEEVLKNLDLEELPNKNNEDEGELEQLLLGLMDKNIH